MTLRRRDWLKLAGSTAGALGVSEARASSGIIKRDVCILGGGSAGTYAALRLRDQGASVVVVERTGRLGGHAETFHDPATGTPIDIGVVIFPDNPLVRNYFGRFNVPLIAPPAGPRGASQFVDFRTGTPIAAYTPSQAELGAALVTYLQLVSGPFGYLAQNGYQLPDSPADLQALSEPFGKFAHDRGLDPLLPLFFLYVQGFGELLKAPALYVLKNMGPEVIGGVLGGSFLTVPTGVGGLYEAATAALGDDVLLDSTAVTIQRPPRGNLTVVVATPDGLRLVKCQKLLVTAPPLVTNLLGLDLDFHELGLLAKFKPNFYWTAVAKTRGLPPGLSLVNAAPETFANLAPLPGIYSLSPTPVPGLTSVKYGSDCVLTDHAVQTAIERDVERVVLPDGTRLSFDGFATFKSHSPYALMVSPSDIKGGFYASLAGLQGYRRTFYASATFQTHSSAAIWAYIEGLLPNLLAA